MQEILPSSLDGPLPSPPSDLSAVHFRIKDDHYAVFSFPARTANLPDSLSPCERDVLRAVVRGDSNREIAKQRGTSERTVANQVQAIFRKVGVHSRCELAAWFARSGMRL
jgi:DNA-binding NarL/FixJ family response regulator